MQNFRNAVGDFNKLKCSTRINTTDVEFSEVGIIGKLYLQHGACTRTTWYENCRHVRHGLEDLKRGKFKQAIGPRIENIDQRSCTWPKTSVVLFSICMFLLSRFLLCVGLLSCCYCVSIGVAYYYALSSFILLLSSFVYS